MEQQITQDFWIQNVSIGYDPTVIGPPTWKLLHMLPFLYYKKDKDDNQTPALFLQLLLRIQQNFGCKKPCGEQFFRYIQQHPPLLASRTSFVIYLHRLHNAVNKRLGKPEYTLEQLGSILQQQQQQQDSDIDTSYAVDPTHLHNIIVEYLFITALSYPVTNASSLQQEHFYGLLHELHAITQNTAVAQVLQSCISFQQLPTSRLELIHLLFPDQNVFHFLLHQCSNASFKSSSSSSSTSAVAATTTTTTTFPSYDSGYGGQTLVHIFVLLFFIVGTLFLFGISWINMKKEMNETKQQKQHRQRQQEQEQEHRT